MKLPMKTALFHKLVRINLIACLLVFSLSFMFPLLVRAGNKGQQISIKVCYANSVRVEGKNQSGQSKLKTVNTDSKKCGEYRIEKWWWIGNVTVTAYFSSGKRQYVVKVPASQQNDWFSISIPSKPEDKPKPWDEILTRAKKWVDKGVTYNQNDSKDGYRTDCSGFISYAWKLPESPDTVHLQSYSYQLSSLDKVQPGDAINNQQPGNEGHVVLFVRWIDKAKGTFVAYEENAYYKEAVETQLTFIKITNSLGYILEYKNIPQTWVVLRKNGL